jgi:hypothetical protein
MSPSCLILPVDGPATATTYDDETVIEFLLEAIGADTIDKTTVDFFDGYGRVLAWVGDHSLLDGSQINKRATLERDRIRAVEGDPPHPSPLCGTVVFTAFDRMSGENIDLPDAWLTAWLPHTAR